MSFCGHSHVLHYRLRDPPNPVLSDVAGEGENDGREEPAAALELPARSDPHPDPDPLRLPRAYAAALPAAAPGGGGSFQPLPPPPPPPPPGPPPAAVGAASAGPASARASADRQTPSKTPAPEAAAPAAPAHPAKRTPQPTEESLHPQPPSQQEPVTQSKSQSQSQLQSQPESQPRSSSRIQPTKSTAIPIPAPRRRPSIPSGQRTSSPTPTIAPVRASTGSATPSETVSPSIAKPQSGIQKSPRTSQIAPESAKRPRLEPPADSRPAKRTKVAEPVIKPTTTPRQEPLRTETSTQVQPSQHGAAPTATPRSAKKSAKSTTKQKQSAEEIADDVVAAVAEKKPRVRRKRQPTPEDAESIEISPTVVKMSDLCRDLRTGKKSKREMELQSMDLTELTKKQKEREERIRNGRKTPKAGSAERNVGGDDDLDRAEAAALGGPQMRIVNGEIVVDAASLQIDRHANAARNEGDMEEVEENPLTKRINAASFGKRTKVESWDEDMTDLFYRGLRMFGTDFMMISKMFPGRSRRQIKLKFSNEERRYPERIKETLLGPREAVDLATYSEMTNTIYDDPRIIEQELDEEKKRIEAEHAREKEAREELMRNPGGVSSATAVTGAGGAAGPSDSNVLPSIEGGVNGPPLRGRKKGAGAHKFGGGTEEILGTIDAGGTCVITEQMAVMAATSHQYVAVVLAVEAMFANIGGAIGQTVAAAIWTGVFPQRLVEYLPEETKGNASLIYADLNVQKSYPVGSLERNAINRAYGDGQKFMLIGGTAILAVSLGATMMWRDIKVKDFKQVKGLVI
ncbi:hypothetical protein ACJ72_04775 [Emergomyces africanus]|uniref:Myb-like domain-containing protein n=1 Tax=Emergomyces africanus TaxID=1955775 RepID=A0A1B7NVS4_9EURO|nr:hypothetical protein ACJ72_04775 [Emergomyces africanus]